jgi:hypothetical protein
VDLQVKTLKANIANEPATASKLNDLEDSVLEQAKRYYPDIRFDKIYAALDAIIANSGIQATGITFTPPVAQAVTLQKTTVTAADPWAANYGQLPAAATAKPAATAAPSSGTTTAASAKNANMVYLSTAQVQCTGTYAQIHAFVEYARNADRMQVVSIFEMTRNADGSYKSTISIDYYAVPKLIVQDGDYLN